ncbi:DNA polymerase I [Candidatus Saccharibacteria bacterium]|nr:DNA polymerase I [Candidatus Saccharibacteria bacterium]
MKKLVIIDGKSVFYRGYYAMGNLSTSDGTPTGGVYGFAVIAMEIVKELQPTKVVVAWDKAKTSISKRKEIYPDYKAGRVKPPEDFFTQIPLLKNLISALGWGFLECDDYEADDIIGTLAMQADKETEFVEKAQQEGLTSEDEYKGKSIWDTVIVSSDLDMLQIVDDNTRMYRLIKGFSKLEEMDVPAVEEKYGILKSQFLDLKALKGDSSDNIPGVPGVGEKTAVKLLNDYGTLEGIYAHIDEISGSVQKKLIAGRESAFMSYELGKIMTDAPVSLSEVPDLVINVSSIENALKMLEFNSVLRKFKAEISKIKANEFSEFKVVEEEQDTSSETPSRAESKATQGQDPSGVDFSLGLRRTVPEEGPASSSTDFRDYIVAKDVKKLMHLDGKIAKDVLDGKKFWDLDQAEFLLNPLKRVVAEEKQEGLYFGETEEEKAANLELATQQKAELSKMPRLQKIYTDYDLPLIPVLYKMEKEGIKVSKEYFKQLEEEYKDVVSELEQGIYDLAGREFNVNSPVQLQEVLFEDLELPTKGIKKTRRGYSTGAKELDKLKDVHAIIPKIMEYREAAKLLNTYIVPLPALADSQDRIHTTFTQNVTATGRLSSINPNLQNIPVRTEEGKRIRTGFIAGAGKSFVSADYSQFELRLAAVLSGDTKLISDFNSGVDIHTKTAADVFGIPVSEVTKVQRRAAKTINFGVMYGMSAKGLADATGMYFGEAKQFISDYFAVRKPIREYLDNILKQAREEGYVETFYGRVRPTPDVHSPNFVVRQAAERAAMNMPIQGTEADLMKRAMISVDSLLPDDAELILQIHDSLIVECDDALVDSVSKILVSTMEGIAPELDIKLAVEVTTGKNWGEL